MRQYRISKRKNFPILLIGVCVTALILYGLVTEGYSLKLLVLLSIFGLLTILGSSSYLINLFKPILVFDTIGISGFSVGSKVIPWTQISSISLHKQGIRLFQQKYMKVSVTNQMDVKIYLSYLNDNADSIFNSACENQKVYGVIVS